MMAERRYGPSSHTCQGKLALGDSPEGHNKLSTVVYNYQRRDKLYVAFSFSEMTGEASAGDGMLFLAATKWTPQRELPVK